MSAVNIEQFTSWFSCVESSTINMKGLAYQSGHVYVHTLNLLNHICHGCDHSNIIALHQGSIVLKKFLRGINWFLDDHLE